MFFNRGASLFVFIAVLLIEIYLFALVGDWLGAGLTVLLVIACSFVGVSLLRRQGVMNVTSVQEQMQQGKPPTLTILNNMLRSFAALMLILPGFFTGAIGILMLLPPVRDMIVRTISKRVQGQFTMYSQQFQQQYQNQQQQNPENQTQPKAEHKPRTFEGEVEHRDD